MSYQELKIKKEYRSLLDNMARDFYIPLLNETVLYKRAVGFFSSSVLAEIATGIIGLVKNCGKIKIITSPKLTDEDITAIRTGYQERDVVVRKALQRELKVPQNNRQADKLNFLANLISDGMESV